LANDWKVPILLKKSNFSKRCNFVKSPLPTQRKFIAFVWANQTSCSERSANTPFPPDTSFEGKLAKEA